MIRIAVTPAPVDQLVTMLELEARGLNL